MKRITIELYLPDDQEVNDINVGRALGEAIMTDTLGYSESQRTDDERDVELLIDAMKVYK